ncbi:MAG: 16S rRNA (guanine(527)-N(7))-methyltransferase RsmG [Candidatus Dependentiae bacterium]|nr:16S rRNA (guanine(527)-N(7))-methyltransferase RsmG [Candidatus Dependentiae bacterium]
MKIDLASATRWSDFAQDHMLDTGQLLQFRHYYDLLIEWNERINLTAITAEQDVIDYHFSDSLLVGRYLDLDASRGLIDVGSGAGFPGIPLKIKYPSLPVYLIEVTLKKCSFLELVIKALGLTQISVISLDWRTFLRKTEYPADTICARASLRPDELVQAFKASSHYREAMLIYWASADWEVERREEPYLLKEELYLVGNKRRRYVFFAAQP